MSVYQEAIEAPQTGAGAELAKLAAFFRRDFLIAWSYKMVFFSDAANLLVQAFMFTFLGKLIDPSVMPTYGGTHAGYIEFVAVGLIVSAYIQLSLSRVGAAIRQEQLMGTLDSLLLTPTRPLTIQLGSAAYDFIYLPIRTGLFLLFIVVAFGAHFEASGLLPSFVVLLLFAPFVWGLGVLGAAGQLTFRRGSGGVNFGASLLVLGSGAFFPLSLMPHWFQVIARGNPIAVSMIAMRSTLIGGASWSSLGTDFAILAPSGLLMLALGFYAFQRSLRRERRRGTIGIY